MGKQLSSWERAQREREKRRAREEAAQFRARERSARRSERERERAQIRRERENERARKQAEREALARRKESQKQNQIEAWRREVQRIEAFLGQMGGLHRRSFSTNALNHAYDSRIDARPLPDSPFVKDSFGKTFQKKTFHPRQFDGPLFQDTLWANKAETAKSMKIFGFVLLALAAVGVLMLFSGSMGSSGGSQENIFGSTILYGVAGFMLSGIFLFVIGARNGGAARAGYAREEAEMLNAHQESEHQRRNAHEANEKKRRVAFDKAVADFEAREVQRQEAWTRFETETASRWAVYQAERAEVLKHARDGNAAAVEMLCEALLPLNPRARSPWESVAEISDHEVAYEVIDATHVAMLIHLPHPDVVPERTAEMNAAGNRIKYVKLNQTRRKEIYENFVCSFALHHAMSMFEACPSVTRVTIECCRIEPNPSTGEDAEVTQLWVVIDQSVLDRIRIERVDPIEVLTNFEHSYKPLKSRSKKALEAKVDRENLLWATDDDEGFDLPPGLLDPDAVPRPVNPHARPSEASRYENKESTSDNGDADEDTIYRAMLVATVKILAWAVQLDGKVMSQERSMVHAMVNSVAGGLGQDISEAAIDAILDGPSLAVTEIKQAARLTAQVSEGASFELFKMAWSTTVMGGGLDDRGRGLLLDLAQWLGLDSNDVSRAVDEAGDQMIAAMDEAF